MAESINICEVCALQIRKHNSILTNDDFLGTLIRRFLMRSEFADTTFCLEQSVLDYLNEQSTATRNELIFTQTEKCRQQCLEAHSEDNVEIAQENQYKLRLKNEILRICTKIYDFLLRNSAVIRMNLNRIFHRNQMLIEEY